MNNSEYILCPYLKKVFKTKVCCFYEEKTTGSMNYGKIQRR